MNKILFTGLLLVVSLLSFGQTRVEAEAYTAMSGISIENGWGDGGSTNIAPIDQGDWMEYSINPAATGLYTFFFRIGTVSAGAQIKIKKQDGTVLATIGTIPNTVDYQFFHSVAAMLNLTAGAQTIRIESSAPDKWTFNWFEYYYGYKIEAESYSGMSGVGVEGTSDAGGGQDVGWIDQGDWMDYPVTIVTAGTYAVKLRLATPNNLAQLQIKKSDGTVLTTVNVPNTGSNQIWQTIDAAITLSSGQQTLRLQSAAVPVWNFNWWMLVPAATNANPIVNAGADQTVDLTASTVNLSGTASDPDGSISTYAWTKLSGPEGCYFGTPSLATTSVNGLVQGSYVFRLTVTDSQGATAADDLVVTVNASAVDNGNGWLTTGNSSTNSTLHFIGTNDAQPLIFKTNGQKQAQLTIDGVFMARRIRVTQSGWADFVFDKHYLLPSLQDVEEYIQKNKHLPSVPSAGEIEKKGLDLGDNQTVLLQKIEELTLYMIQMNKEIESLRHENAELKKQVQAQRK